jgi:hypothetical protein
MDPVVMFFFRDELEKQAVLTPASALKAMNYAKPGIIGNMVRGAGRLGAKVQQVGADLTPAVRSLNEGLQSGIPATAVGSFKGNVANYAMKKSGVTGPKGRLTRALTTGEARFSNAPVNFNPLDVATFG